ncbi:MAG TPA: GMC family oxidoreductase, partial [Candidatus Angelobacter sp.]|nr:GMC family oxidoreductase [Candidatus Angelobacter sp.]
MHKAQTFDAIVIGSGMAGGTAARELCKAGLKVLVLEAGPSQPQSQTEYGHSIQKRCYAFGENTRQYFVNDRDNPYFTHPNQPFSWIRARALGGRSLLWAGHCYRMTDLEFLAANEDGVGVNWPITSEEIAPYYDKAESILGVTDRTHFGGIEGANQLAYDEKHFGEAFAKVGPRLIRARLSRIGSLGDGKTPCLHCGRVAANCSRPAASPDTTLAEALKTGRLTIRTQSPVSHITADGNGSPTIVCGIDQRTGKEFAVKGRMIFLCASTLESTRILLNSRSSRFPDGLANSSGVLGHYLMDHVSGIVVTGSFDRPSISRNVDYGARMFYIPRWQNLGGHRSDRFLRGYGYEMFVLPADHELLPCGGTQSSLPGQAGKASGNTVVSLCAFGEMLPRYDNFVEIDQQGRKDAWGIP